MPDISIIIPSSRNKDLISCLKSIYQQSFKNFEVIVICDKTLEIPEYDNLKILQVSELNPAYRRNLGVKYAQGEILAFIDDDAIAETDWLENAWKYLDKNKEICAIGGPDPINLDAPFLEKVSNVLLENKYLGSGVLSHSGYTKIKILKSASALSLCNLFVRKEVFNKIGGFNEGIGYGGEDTEFMYLLMKKLNCKIVYNPYIKVYHKKRKFGLPYLKQRLKFRINNGKMIFVYPGMYLKNAKFVLFLFAVTSFLILSIINPIVFSAGIISYFIITFLISLKYIIKDPRFIILPFAFFIQHSVYYAGIIIGLSNVFQYKKLRKIRRHF